MKLNLNRIEYEMDKKGLTKLKLAGISGVTRQTLYNLFSHPGSFHAETVEKIAKALDIKQPKDLLEE